MKIVFFHNSDRNGSFGGACRCTLEFASRLAEAASVELVTPYPAHSQFAAAAASAKIKLHVLSERDPGPINSKSLNLMTAANIIKSAPELLRLQQRSARILAGLRPDAVCCSDFKHAWIVGTTGSLRKLPLVVYLHGWYTADMIPRYAKKLARRRIQLIPVVSRHTKTAVIAAGFPSEKVRVLHNPIDVIETTNEASSPLQAPLPQRDRSVRMLFVGSVYPGKGLHTAVSGLQHVLRMGHDAVLWIAGHPADREYAQRVKEMAGNLNLDDRVEWLGARNDIPQLMKKSTALVLPSHSEGHPRVVLEAMAVGLPVVACPVGGIQDMVFPRMTGLFFEPDDDIGLANCINDIVSKPDDAERMADTARDYLLRSFSCEQHTATLLRWFEEVSCGKSSQRNGRWKSPLGQQREPNTPLC